MNRRPRLVAGAALLAGAAFIALTLGRTDWGRALATSPLELIPAGDRTAELAAVRQLAGDAQSRAMLVRVTAPEGRAAEAADAMRKALNTDPLAPGMGAVNPFDMTARRDSGKRLFEARHALLLPAWLARSEAELRGRGEALTPETLAALAVRRLDAFLATDPAFAFEKITPADPLLLTADATLPLLKEVGPKPSPDRALLWVDTGRPPLDGAARVGTFAAMERAEAAMRKSVPGATAGTTGVAVFAEASERAIKGELGLLNGASLVGVALICALMLRRVAILPHVAALIALSGGFAWAATLLAFGRVHVFSAALGALLSGIAVDYALYAMLHDGADGRPASFSRLRPILRPLLAGALIASAGFAFLMLSPLPAMRQTGFFTASGILASLGFSLAWGSVFRFRHGGDAPAKEAGSADPARGRAGRCIALAGFAALIAGIPFVSWRDSLRDLEYPLPEIRERDREIRAAFGESSRRLWLVSGESCGEAISRLRDFAAEGAKTGDPRAAVRGPFLALATPAEHARADRFAREHGADFARAFRAALTKAEYRPEDFSGFFSAWETLTAQGLPEHEPAAMRLLSGLTGPESMLVSLRGERRLLVCWTDASAPMPTLGESAPAFPLNNLESLNTALGRYRENMLRLVVAGFVCTVALNLLVMRRLSAVRDFAIPAGVAAAAMGATGWLGAPLTLFHLAGGFLALCCALHYPMFAREARDGGRPFPRAVTLAWATTAISFGTLTFSRIPAVSALGVSVLAVVTATYALLRLDARR